MEPGGAEPFCNHQGPLGPQEEGCGGSVCKQLAGGPQVSHLADGRAGCGAAAGTRLPASLPGPPGSLSVFLLLFSLRRWWERGLGRPALTRCRPSIQPLRPR